MKPFLSFCSILILLQTLILGSLVKLEFPDINQDQWGETIIHSQLVLDPFLMPGKDGYNQNFQYKNDWVPFHCSNTYQYRNNVAFPKANEYTAYSHIKSNHATIPVFIMYGILRI
jgi:hypothetical protein